MKINELKTLKLEHGGDGFLVILPFAWGRSATSARKAYDIARGNVPSFAPHPWQGTVYEVSETVEISMYGVPTPKDGSIVRSRGALSILK